MKNEKKEFFKKKIKEVTYVIWDLEFKIEKSSQVREKARQNRDIRKDSLFKIEELLKNDKKNKELLAQKEAIEKEITGFEAQMKLIDDQINGVPDSETEMGVQGIVELIDTYAELREMYKDYLKKI